MPKKYKTRRPYKRRRRRNKGWNKRTGPRALTSTPLGNKFRFKTRYVDLNNTLNPGIGGVAVTHVYSLNSLFDPDFTGVGHQPIGFDQIMGTMYDHYTVIGARARIKFTNADTTGQNLCLIQVKDNPTVNSDLQAVIENGRARYAILNPEGSGGMTKTMTTSVNLSKFFGRSVMAGDKYQGTSATSPDDQCYLHVSVQGMNAVDTGPVIYTVEIEYIAILTEPKVLASS